MTNARWDNGQALGFCQGNDMDEDGGLLQCQYHPFSDVTAQQKSRTHPPTNRADHYHFPKMIKYLAKQAF